MRTTLTPEKLAELAVRGRAEAAVNPFVDPCVARECSRILRERGEDWAASVLLRPNLSTRRSLMHPEFPWLHEGEMQVLVWADRAEWDALDAQVTSGEEER